ncbi:hypothetical protein GTW38_11765 [Streptomyces sp. SID7804]|uniref:hypothetical protein n=1 Tax=Streptomyces TaxID=1883 RepID=UPI00136D3950|nr:MULTISPECIES: hypothetical protein [Streptomyces]MBA8980216.1 hypothetical protein [Streptomyces calvus]MYS27593.1 hypothetical protein [Streptomyces sp. SID7804]
MREVADQLAFEVADSLRQNMPTDALGPTLRHAVMEDSPPRCASPNAEAVS